MDTRVRTPSEQQYAEHTQKDAALATDETSDSAAAAKGLTLPGKIALFLGFPLLVGILGLYFAFLETRKKPERELSLDQDFIMPFLLALAMVTVIGLQTQGYTSRKLKPIVAWPKVKRVKKVVYKKKGDDVNEEDKKTKWKRFRVGGQMKKVHVQKRSELSSKKLFRERTLRSSMYQEKGYLQEYFLVMRSLLE